MNQPEFKYAPINSVNQYSHFRKLIRSCLIKLPKSYDLMLPLLGFFSDVQVMFMGIFIDTSFRVVKSGDNPNFHQKYHINSDLVP